MIRKLDTLISELQTLRAKGLEEVEIIYDYIGPGRLDLTQDDTELWIELGSVEAEANVAQLRVLVQAKC